MTLTLLVVEPDGTRETVTFESDNIRLHCVNRSFLTGEIVRAEILNGGGRNERY